MEIKNDQYKWLDNIASSICSLVVAGGIEEYYDYCHMDIPCFGFDETKKRNAYFKFSPKGIEALKPFIPYCLHPVWQWEMDENNKPFGYPFFKKYIWLNRYYKPLGCANGKFYDYKHYKDLHICSKSDAIESISKILPVFEGHEQEPIYECYRKLQNKKQVVNLIEKLVKIMSIFTTQKRYEQFIN